MPSAKPTIAFRVDPPLYKKLVEEAKRQGRSTGNYVTQLILSALNLKK